MFGDVVINKILAKQAAVHHFRAVRFDDATLPEYYSNILPPVIPIFDKKTVPVQDIRSILENGMKDNID